jgi:glycosyltransferase involved in cell wall biosynthesis
VKIAILSCFYPYRGGIAQFNANLTLELGNSHTVQAFNFKRQYPGILFPGKTQFVTEEDKAIPIESTPVLDTINPLSYISSAKLIRQWEPDLLIMRYWMSFFGPSLGYVARHLNPRTKVISILDNVVPHEKRFIDKPFTKYFLGGSDGFVVLSESVGKDLLQIKKDAHYITIPHPVYDHFGQKTARAEAESKLGIDPGKKNLLFFGLIRDYKGLDILIDAFAMLDDSYQLVIAGEPYGSFEKYSRQIETSPAKARIKLFNRYIDDTEVALFFSSADLTVLPYRTATQSGISAISYHFGVPLLTTDVGGLKEAVEEPGTGIVVDYPDSSVVADGILRFFTEGRQEEYIANIEKHKQQLSWNSFANKLIDFYNTL